MAGTLIPLVLEVDLAVTLHSRILRRNLFDEWARGGELMSVRTIFLQHKVNIAVVYGGETAKLARQYP